MIRSERIDAAAAVAPGAQVVVLGPGAVDLRGRRAVDEEHVVALAPPVALILEDALGHADEVAPPLSVEDQVVARAVLVRPAVDQSVAVAGPVGGPAGERRRLTVLRVEVAQIRRQRLVLLPIDVVVE